MQLKLQIKKYTNVGSCSMIYDSLSGIVVGDTNRPWVIIV